MSYKLAQHHDLPNYDEEKYLGRTKRNHFFVGGIEGQKSIKDLKVGIAGLGGMGSNVAEALVRMGVGHIRISDPDIIEASNIQRQVIANQNTVGQSKALAMRDKLLSLGNDFELVTYTSGITSDTVEEFIDGLDIVVDEIDVYPLDKHVLLHKEARSKNLPIYSAFIVGYGIRFYKYFGEEYKFEDFIAQSKIEDLEKPTAQNLIDIFGSPLPDYLKGENLDRLSDAINTGDTPIFGASALMGHSFVCLRLVLDYLKSRDSNFKSAFGTLEETPVMPEFISCDFGEIKIQKAKAS